MPHNLPADTPTRANCRCGGVLKCVAPSLEAKAASVREHATSEMHRLWVAKGRPDIFRIPPPHRPLLHPEPPPDAAYEGRLSPQTYPPPVHSGPEREPSVAGGLIHRSHTLMMTVGSSTDTEDGSRKNGTNR